MGAFDPATILENLYWLKPEILLTIFAFLLLGLSVALPAELRHWAGWVGLVGILVAAILVVSYAPSVPFGAPKLEAGATVGAFADPAGRPSFVLDGFALFFKGLFLFAAALTILSAMKFLDVERAQGGEFYALVLFAVIGMMLLASGNDFATLYIGLETTALSSYVLVGFTRANPRSNEAALKYFVLGAFASAVLVYGVSLVYGATGTIHIGGIAGALAAAGGKRTLADLGAVLILVGLGFKIAAFPFHMWAPDVYEGAPSPVAGFVSTATKAAAFAMILRVYLQGFYPLVTSWTPLLVLLSVASMTFGNVAAVRQDNVKRMLAYSSIAQAGYLLMGLIAVGAARGDERIAAYGMTAVAIHLLVYTVTNLGAFGLVTMLRRGETAGDRIDDFRGLSARKPVAAAAMVVFLLSLAGIPCTAGFIGKWWLFGAVIQADMAWLAVVAVVNSAISLFYYARVVVAMYMTAGSQEGNVAVPAGLSAALAIACALTLWIGVYPSPFIRLAQTAVFPIPGR